MRAVILAIISALVLAAAPVQAAWEPHHFEDLGFRIDFPAEPRMSRGEWRGAIAGLVPTIHFAAEFNHVSFEAIIVDFADRVSETPTLLGEAGDLLGREGTLVVETMARTDNGPNSIYGRRITVMLENGAKKTSQIHATDGRLYIFVVTISPEGDLGSTAASRFQDSISFNLDAEYAE
jgi:hypothetical protein